MYDISHAWGGDLVVGNGGDLALAAGSDAVSQRVCRRLLTNAGDYIWNLDYGGGLGQFVGLATKAADIEAVILNQLLLETSVPTTPAPQVTTTVVDATNGYVVANITYTDPTLQQSVTFSLKTG
jgi:hypothetical protein